MNKLVKKIACAVMAFTLIAGVFTGCKTNKSAKTTIAMPNYTSVKDPSGNLPEKGTVGDMEYRILKKGELGSYNTSRGYYLDMVDELNAPLLIVICAGTHKAVDAEIKIVDVGMDGSTLVIVVDESKGSGEKNKELDCPTCTLEVDHEPSDLLIVTTAGEKFEKVNPYEG